MALLKRIFIIVFGLVFCAGCMNMPRTELREASNQKLAWEKRKLQLEAVKSWQIAGAIAVKNKKHGGQLRFNWQQKQQQYDINLTAPLGGLIAIIKGQPGAVSLAKPNANPVKAKDPAVLVQQELGWSFPVNHIRHWIRGLPAPGVESKLTFDEFQHVKTLTQSGWTVDFVRYTQVKGVDVPAKIVIKRSPLFIRMVVTSWT